MALTKALNSKANIKQFSNADLPVNPRQPVIAKYGPVASTADQTVINLTFSVDQSNTDAFFLSVDGKILSLGSSNDFTFTSIAADNTSSQITLNQPLSVNLNIQAWKLGLKKESEFQTDNRFVSHYEMMGNAFQNFILANSTLSATTSTGTPAAGRFYSSIVNRASIVDITNDLRASMGIERISVQQLVELQNEFGPNGERVFSALNDDRGLIRFVGSWSNNINSFGQYVIGPINSTTEYVEVAFYGTGLNILTQTAATTRSYAVSTDGGSTTNVTISSSSYSGVLNGRNYNPNCVVSLVSGLSLGVHTARIALTSGASDYLLVMGFEILNEASTIKVNSGTAYISGQKALVAAQQSIAYNSAFESGSLSTRGGRVLVYAKSDGTIAKAVTPTNGAAAYIASADHTNEEVARSYHFREFGAGRVSGSPSVTDDFSGVFPVGGGGAVKAFTLDDGTTTLSCSTENRLVAAGVEAVGGNSIGAFITLTFVGTGLDVRMAGGGGSSLTASIDGGATQAITGTTDTNFYIQKIVSGLPYGTHTVKFNRGSSSGSNYGISNFIVYQPKKPTLPAGAVELADYNIMATYAVSSTEDQGNSTVISTGTLFKGSTREAVYVGTWSIGAVSSTIRSGFYAATSTSGDYVEYTFFGTGIEIFTTYNTTANNRTIQIDGVAYTGAATLGYNGSPTPTWTPGTSTWLDGGSSGSTLQISGLTLGVHKVRVTKSTATDQMIICGFNVITPIHSHKSNLYGDIQNTLPVGSCAISDNRKTTITKDSAVVPKAWAQAIGVTSSPTVTSTTMIPMPDMSLTVKTNGGPLELNFMTSLSSSTAIGVANTQFQFYVDGVAVGVPAVIDSVGANDTMLASNSVTVPVAAGTHKVDVYWLVSSGTTTAGTTRRILRAKEI